MKKILLVIAMVAASASAFAQGNIDFINRNIGTKADPTVQYNVPIYVANGRATGTGAGNLAGGVTLGLFLAGAADTAAPIFSQVLRTGTPVQAQFLFSSATTSTTATIPGVAAGATANLLVRAWQGSSFDADKNQGAGQWNEWAFTSAPLGGTPPGGGLPVATPGMTGWGPEDGSGLELVVPEPSTIALGVLGVGALVLRRRIRHVIHRPAKRLRRNQHKPQQYQTPGRKGGHLGHRNSGGRLAVECSG